MNIMVLANILNVNWTTDILSALKYTALGMIGIFIVTGLIIDVISALSYFPNKPDAEGQGEDKNV